MTKLAKKSQHWTYFKVPDKRTELNNRTGGQNLDEIDNRTGQFTMSYWVPNKTV